MCGLAGAMNVTDGAHVVAAMTSTLARRGPDDEGRWQSPCRSVHLGFRRLSVMDTSDAGHQPMSTADGWGTLVFNGEVYNFRELRRDLERSGVAFRSDTDTEVVLHLLRRDGVAGLSRLNGMFALAYVDVVARTVLLARDQFGIKPLFYARQPHGPGVAFASRYDALFRTGWVDLADYDTGALACLLEMDATPAPYGLHRGTAQVTPGSWIRIGERGIEGEGRWLPAEEDPALLARDRPLTTDPRAAGDAVDAALVDAVGRQRLADVPVGVLLSSGIDSPLVGAALRRTTDGPVRSFTIGEPGSPSDEAPGAAAFARHLGFDHHNLDLGPSDLDRSLLELPAASHEPITGRAMLQMLAVSRLTADQVVVALSGDGGDELFFGYDHTRALVAGSNQWRLPASARRGMIALGRRGFGPVRSGAGEHPHPGSYHRSMLGRGATGLAGQVLGGAELPPDVLALFSPTAPRTRRQMADHVREVELRLHLPFVLKKVDMAAMHHGLEVRVPLLDREVAKAAYAIHPDVHVRGGVGKAVLRAELARRTDPALVTAKKRGFSVGTSDWLRTGLRPQVESALFDPWSCDIDHAVVRSAWDSFLRAETPAAYTGNLIWTLFSLRMWEDRVRADLS